MKYSTSIEESGVCRIYFSDDKTDKPLAVITWPHILLSSVHRSTCNWLYRMKLDRGIAASRSMLLSFGCRSGKMRETTPMLQVCIGQLSARLLLREFARCTSRGGKFDILTSLDLQSLNCFMFWHPMCLLCCYISELTRFVTHLMPWLVLCYLEH